MKRSVSRGKQEGVSSSQVVSSKGGRGVGGTVGVVEEGKKYLESSETGRRAPSVGRRSTATKEHLPELKPVKPKKLEILQAVKR